MSLANYSDLQAAIAAWLAKTGDTNLSPSIPDFVTLCESRIAYGGDENSPFPSMPLRIRAMETAVPLVLSAQTTAVTVGGTANAITLVDNPVVSSLTYGLHMGFTATNTNTGATTLQVDSTAATAVVKGASKAALSGGEIVAGATFETYYDGTSHILMPNACDAPLPTNYLAFRNGYIDVSPRRALEYMSPDQMNRRYPYVSDIGTPDFFTIEGDAIRLARSPDKTYYGRFNYYQKFPALVTATTNWLMTNAPGVYLNGCLLEAAIFLEDFEAAALYHKMFMSLLNALQSQDERDRHSGVLQMRPFGTIV